MIGKMRIQICTRSLSSEIKMLLETVLLMGRRRIYRSRLR